jgi:hypothetical protein
MSASAQKALIYWVESDTRAQPTHQKKPRLKVAAGRATLLRPSAFASARWARPAISFRPRERLGILEGPLAVGLIRPDTTAGNVFPIEVFARAAVGESNLIAAALRDGLVPDDLDAADHGLWF